MQFISFLSIISLVCAGNVVILTPDNFDTIIDTSKGQLVEFFAPVKIYLYLFTDRFHSSGVVIVK